MFECLALQVLHHEKVDSALAADIEHQTDVRMAEGDERLGLTFEAPFQLRIGGNMLGKDFDRHDAIEAGVAGFVHLTHPAGTDGGLDLIWAQTSAGLRGHEPR